ncbi:hypothetical protein GCM10010910_28130 [Microbacterium nanhaiense]|uniref:Copper homeostasis protein cutC homolog n=1 Tax=Microbacterium nanhaiense TaxID=1301026 RepID=A0ABQ2N564_9MICO|nr:copper homeostasis protein CutC [Microbacterium nanhaiense]GGO67107.1 hypothetical protein GCM10010910_28130 [Microbacterium nanhaiense]
MLAGLGVDRVLTSAGAACAADAPGELAALVQHARGRVQVMAGGGITSDNVAAVLAAGVDAVHASAKRTVGTEAFALGSAGPSPHETTDVEHVRRIAEIARRGAA